MLLLLGSVRGSWVVAVIWLLSHLPKEWNSRFLNALLAYKNHPRMMGGTGTDQ